MLALLLAATPSPAPSTALNDASVTPGVVGFIAILVVTLATIALIVDMTRRIRRIRYRAAMAERTAQQSPPAS